jgi:hypothetical protein
MVPAAAAEISACIETGSGGIVYRKIMQAILPPAPGVLNEKGPGTLTRPLSSGTSAKVCR